MEIPEIPGLNYRVCQVLEFQDVIKSARSLRTFLRELQKSSFEEAEAAGIVGNFLCSLQTLARTPSAIPKLIDNLPSKLRESPRVWDPDGSELSPVQRGREIRTVILINYGGTPIELHSRHLLSLHALANPMIKRIAIVNYVAEIAAGLQEELLKVSDPEEGKDSPLGSGG